MKNFSEKSWKQVKEDLYKRQGKALVKKTGSDNYVKLDKFSIGGEVKNVVIGKTVPHYEDWRDGVTYFSPKGMFRFRAMLHDNGFVADDDAFGGKDTRGKYSLYLDQITWGMPIRSSVPCDTMWNGFDEIICRDPWEEHNFLRDENGEKKEFENYTKFQEYLDKNRKNRSLKNKITLVKDGTSYKYFLLTFYSDMIVDYEIESLWQDYMFIPFAPRIIFPYKDMQPISHANYVEKYPEDEQNYSQSNKYYIGGKGGDYYEYFKPDYDWPCNTTYDYTPSYGYSLKSSAMVPVYIWKYTWGKYKYKDWFNEYHNDYDNYDNFNADYAEIRLMPYKRLGLEIILDSHPDWQPNVAMATRYYKCKAEDGSESTKYYDIYGEFLEHYPNYSGYTDTDNEFGGEWGIHDWVLDLKNKWHWSSEIDGCDVIVEFQFPPIIYNGKRYPINAITKSNGRVCLMHLDSGEGTSPYLRVDGGRVTCTKPFPSIVNTDNVSFMEWKDYYTLPDYDYKKFTSGECASYPSEFKEFISNPKKCLVLNKKKTLTRSSVEYLSPSDAQSYEEGDKYGYNWGDTDEIWLTGGDGKGYKIIAGNTSNNSIRYMPTSYTGAPATYRHYYYYRKVNDKNVTDEMREKKVVLDSVPTSFPVNSPSAPKYVGIECAKSYVQLNTGKTNYSTYVTTEMENTAPYLLLGVPPKSYVKIEDPSDSIKNLAIDGIINLSQSSDGISCITFDRGLNTSNFENYRSIDISYGVNTDTVGAIYFSAYSGSTRFKRYFEENAFPTLNQLDNYYLDNFDVLHYQPAYSIISTQKRQYYQYSEESGNWEKINWDDIDSISGETATDILKKKNAVRMGLSSANPTDYIYYKYDDETQQYIQDSGLTDEQKASSIELNFIPEAKSSVISAISYTSITETGYLVRNSANTPTYIHISGVYSPSYYNNNDLFDKTKYYYTKEITGYYKLQNNYDNKYVAYGASDWDSTAHRYWRNYYVLKEYDFYELKEVEGYESMIIKKNRKYKGRYSILLGRNHTTAHYNVRYSRSRRNPLDGDDKMNVKITCYDCKHMYKDYYKQVFLNESITSSNGKLGKAHSNTFYKKIIPLHRGYKSIYQKNITVHRRKNIFFY
jgi:hypothetical protein